MRRNKLLKITKHLLLILIGCLFLLPALWMLFASFDYQASQSIRIPSNPSLINYLSILTDMTAIKGFFMSFIIAGGQTSVIIVISFCAAYPLSRYNLKKAQSITFSLLFLTAIPMTAVMVPVYQLFILLGLVDSIYGTILFMATTGLPYGIWMTKNFLDSVSVDLEEAAWIDGASSFQALRIVVLPLMKPGIFTVIIYSFVRSWGNFFIPFILLQSVTKLPASVKIYRFFGDRGEVMFGPLCAYSLLYLLPAILLYSFAQNYMSKGFAMGGATKG